VFVSPAHEAAVGAKTLSELFERLPLLCGYESPSLFRQQCDPHEVRGQVRTPLLCLNSLNDPLSVADNIDYQFFEDDAHDCAALATVSAGAHIEFSEWRSWARPHAFWADEVALDFLEATMQLAREERTAPPP